MVSDSIINASVPNSPKEFTKKKRANRSAKLKQCKLDARREQWLSQVKNKGLKEQGSGNRGGNGELNGPTAKTQKAKGKEPCNKGLEVRNVSVDVMDNHESDSEESSPANSLTSEVNESGHNYVESSGSSTSSSSACNLSFGSGGYCSGSITEEEEVGGGEFGGDDEILDDWEAVADALVAADANDEHDHDNDHSLDEEVTTTLVHDSGKPDSERVENLVRDGVNTKAWRSDDAFRPQSLPNLSKQRSFPVNSERLSYHGLNPWVRAKAPLVPTSCPICYEDLDLTDSSFLPCPCGFHLCLFCHKRILEESGKCPGCRKPYSSEVTEDSNETGGSRTARLVRSCSMFSGV